MCCATEHAAISIYALYGVPSRAKSFNSTTVAIKRVGLVTRQAGNYDTIHVCEVVLGDLFYCVIEASHLNPVVATRIACSPVRWMVEGVAGVSGPPGGVAWASWRGSCTLAPCRCTPAGNERYDLACEARPLVALVDRWGANLAASFFFEKTCWPLTLRSLALHPSSRSYLYRMHLLQS